MNEKFIKAVRDSGLSVEDLAGFSGVSERFIYRYARQIDEPGPGPAYTLAIALGKKPKDLFPDYDE